jgi:hypothetical protein
MIRIAYSSRPLGGLDLSGAPRELREVRDRILAFLESNAESLAIATDARANPCPYDRTLNGLVVQKAEELMRVNVTTDGWVDVRGSCSCLENFASYFNFDDSELAGHHSHFAYWDGHEWIHPDSIPLVIGVSRFWKGEST